MKRRARSRLSYVQRKRLRSSSFALESRRQLPIHDAAHVRAAAARLEMMRNNGHVTHVEYQHARRRIESRAERLGVHLAS